LALQHVEILNNCSPVFLLGDRAYPGQSAVWNLACLTFQLMASRPLFSSQWMMHLLPSTVFRAFWVRPVKSSDVHCWDCPKRRGFLRRERIGQISWSRQRTAVSRQGQGIWNCWSSKCSTVISVRDQN
jgi:hypothetical protein